MFTRPRKPPAHLKDNHCSHVQSNFSPSSACISFIIESYLSYDYFNASFLTYLSSHEEPKSFANFKIEGGNA